MYIIILPSSRITMATHHGNAKTFKGDNMTIYGNSNSIKGDNNIIYGNSNSIKGDNNTVYGNSNSVIGDKNTVNGNSNSINGDNNKYIGNNNGCKGDNNEFIGIPRQTKSIMEDVHIGTRTNILHATNGMGIMMGNNSTQINTFDDENPVRGIITGDNNVMQYNTFGGDNGTCIDIVNNVKTTKYYKDGKLVKTTVEDLEDNEFQGIRAGGTMRIMNCDINRGNMIGIIKK
jgi:hypothetical protein